MCYRQWNEKTAETSPGLLNSIQLMRLRTIRGRRLEGRASGKWSKRTQDRVCPLPGDAGAACERYRGCRDGVEHAGIGNGCCSTTFREESTFGCLNRRT